MKTALSLALLLTSGVALADDSQFPDPRDSWRIAAAPMVVPALQQVTLGARKRQVYRALGAPHFDEGIGAHQWNYWFAGPGNENCQLRIRFDDNARISALAWNNESCQPI